MTYTQILEKTQAMATRSIRVAVLSVFVPLALAGCVSKSKYEDLEAENQRLQQQLASASAQVSASQAQVSRLQNAIKFTVNSDLLFASGGWQMSAAGKDIIAKFTARLAQTQQNKLVVNGYTDNAPVGRELQREGITSNQILSQKRAENVMEFLISQGVKPELVTARGHGDADPVASNSTREGRAQNRRVELSLAGAAP